MMDIRPYAGIGHNLPFADAVPDDEIPIWPGTFECYFTSSIGYVWEAKTAYLGKIFATTLTQNPDGTWPNQDAAIADLGQVIVRAFNLDGRSVERTNGDEQGFASTLSPTGLA